MGAQAAAFCHFADWKDCADDLIAGKTSGELIKESTEDYFYWKDVPSHVFGLTNTGRPNDFIFLVDTELGIVHWPNCPGPIRFSRTKIDEAPIDFAPENEEEWRGDSAWAIPDFFEVLKDELRKLHSIPKNSREVIDIYSEYVPDEVIVAMQNVYHEHGWPNLGQYRKEDCLKAIEAMMVDRFPRHM
jgi:hypothetical protein